GGLRALLLTLEDRWLGLGIAHPLLTSPTSQYYYSALRPADGVRRPDCARGATGRISPPTARAPRRSCYRGPSLARSCRPCRAARHRRRVSAEARRWDRGPSSRHSAAASPRLPYRG